MKRDQYVGITETGDIAFDLAAFNRLHEANIIITKRLTDKVIDGLVANKGRCILHLTVTGWGGTSVEPLAPDTAWSRRQFDKLIARGFPVEQAVLRIDPIILTQDGLDRADGVLAAFADSGVKRYRISFLDMYRHTRERFLNAGFRLPQEGFHAPLQLRLQALLRLKAAATKTGFELEVCGEPDIPSTPCVSQKDIDILGLTDEIILHGSADQRNACGCPANKKQILTKRPGRCGNKCLYCYWKTDQPK